MHQCMHYCGDSSANITDLLHRTRQQLHISGAHCIRLTLHMCRLLSPLLLRQLLLWLEASKVYGSKGGYSVGMGWLWAILLGMSGYLSTLTHHQAFWYSGRQLGN